MQNLLNTVGSKEDLYLSSFISQMSNEKLTSDSFAYGRTGLCLTYSYLGKYLNNEKYILFANQCLQEVFDNFGESDSFKSMDFYNGVCGLLNVVAHLNKHGFADFPTSSFTSLEKAAHDWAITEANKGNYDYFMGATGMLNYYYMLVSSDNLPEEQRQQELFKFNEIWNALSNNITKDDRWLLIPNQRYNAIENKNETAVQFGLAHGMSAPMILLQKVSNLNIGVNYDSVTDKYLNTILDLREQYHPSYPHIFINEYLYTRKKTVYQDRLAWCNSDLNLIHFMAIKNSKAQNRKLENLLPSFSNAIAQRCMDGLHNNTDPFFCHGLSGTAYYLQYIFQITSHSSFQNASIKLKSEAIKHFNETSNKNKINNSDIHSFFYGHPGLCLSWLGLIDPNCSCWSEIILL